MKRTAMLSRGSEEAYALDVRFRKICTEPSEALALGPNFSAGVDCVGPWSWDRRSAVLSKIVGDASDRILGVICSRRMGSYPRITNDRFVFNVSNAPGLTCFLRTCGFELTSRRSSDMVFVLMSNTTPSA